MRPVQSALALVLSCVVQSGAMAAPPLPEEPIPSVATLPETYPASWVLVHDFNFSSIVDGKIVILDTGSPGQPVKGMVRDGQFGSVLFSNSKHEIYTAETFYTRLTRGERTDAITIWDAATLQPKGEIILPGGKRQQSVSFTGLFAFTNHQKWALVANFTPAQSVTVVDLDGRKVLGDIDLPGCAHIYPTGERGFSSLCADGSITSVVLDENGKVASSKTIPGVQDIDHQPLFMMPAMVGQTAWFVSFHGQIKGFDLSGPVARPLPKTASVGTAEGGDPEWRPGGWQVIAADPKGLLYVLMSPNGREGSHKDGGTEVWVIDPVANKRVARLPMGSVVTSIAVTTEANPHLVVSHPDGSIELRSLTDGSVVHEFGHTVAMSPLLLLPVQ